MDLATYVDDEAMIAFLRNLVRIRSVHEPATGTTETRFVSSGSR